MRNSLKRGRRLNGSLERDEGQPEPVKQLKKRGILEFQRRKNTL